RAELLRLFADPARLPRARIHRARTLQHRPQGHLARRAMSWRVERENGIWLPDIGWRLDAREPAELAFVSHAHFDHMGDHREILCSPATAKLIQTRLPGERRWITPEFGET